MWDYFLQALILSGTTSGEPFKARAGVSQGACSMSWPLFTFFNESTMNAIATSWRDGWLGNLHTLTSNG